MMDCRFGIPMRESFPECRQFFDVQTAPTCSTMALVWTIILSRDAMPSNRPNLILDEQAFQDLLSAAYTIQEHNQQMRQGPPIHVEQPATIICEHCGAAKRADEASCETCADGLRPGERLQRNWASMWLMSQEQGGLWPERSGEIPRGVPEPSSKQVPPAATSKARKRARGDSARAKLPQEPLLDKSGLGQSTPDAAVAQTLAGGKSTADSAAVQPWEDLPAELWAARELPGHELGKEIAKKEFAKGEEFANENSAPGLQLSILPFERSANHADREADDGAPLPARFGTATGGPTTDTGDDTGNGAPGEFYDHMFGETTDSAAPAAPVSLLQRWRDASTSLSHHRADLYLAAAVLVALLALLWPTAESPQRPTLGLLDRALITLGIAEAPAPTAHLQGDPAIEVWVDPHTALYYCPGEEQYGKTANGRVTTQREAQMDRFEPASRSACE